LAAAAALTSATAAATHRSARRGPRFKLRGEFVDRADILFEREPGVVVVALRNRAVPLRGLAAVKSNWESSGGGPAWPRRAARLASSVGREALLRSSSALWADRSCSAASRWAESSATALEGEKRRPGLDARALGHGEVSRRPGSGDAT